MTDFLERAESANDPSRVPSARRLEQAISAWQQMRAALIEDEELSVDENIVAMALAQANIDDPRDLLSKLIDAQVWAERRAEEAKTLEHEYNERRARYEARRDRLRLIIEDMMHAIDVRQHQAKLARASFVPAPDSVVIDDIEALDPEFVKVEKSGRKSLIHAAFRAGRAVDGARLSTGGIMLQIKKVR